MELKSSRNHDIPPDLNGHYRLGYGGAIRSEHITGQQRYNNASRRKSKVRLNDQLVPKPTDINMAEKMIKIATPKQHPYSSHISQFAMFPSFCSPDDPETGVRAASQPSLNPFIPNKAPEVTLLTKTLGHPYRHETVETPLKTRKKAVRWSGEHSVLDPLKGENQGFYPSPPKTVLPNPKLRDWDLSLSERTSNMLKNLERSHWVTSYQIHHTGSGPANPLQMDDFKEKLCDVTRMNSHNAPLRERSIPLFVPSKPRGGCRRTCSITAELTNLSPAPSQSIASAALHQRRPPEISAKYNEAPDPNQTGHHSPSMYSSGSTAARSAEVSQSCVYDGRERENCRFQLDGSPEEVSVSQSSQEANTARITGQERPLDLHNCPPSQEDMEVNMDPCVRDEPNRKAGRNVSSNSQSCDLAGGGSHAQLSHSNSCIQPRPPVLPGIHPVETLGRESTARRLLDLQNSFSKTKAHRDFNNSITHAAVNLRDNVVTGKKHDFYGINCYYLHG